MNLISEIQIIPLHQQSNELVAFANFTLAGVMRCKSVAILRRLRGGYRLTYPTKRVGNKQYNYFFPINPVVGQEIEKVIVSEYEHIIKNVSR